MALTRRTFFFGSLLTGAVPPGGFGSVASLRRLGYKSPNEKLNIAAIGAGGRGAANIRACLTENIVALCDVDWDQAAPTFKEFENVPKYKDFRVMLDREHRNIDAVIVSTPDHTHAAAALWAMRLGKHVYCEKPLARTVYECRKLTEAAEQYKVATQMGNQGYSNEGTRLAAEIIWSGEIGDVTEVHAWTNRPIWPQGFDKVPAPTPVPDTLDWDLWLGPVEYRPYTAGAEQESKRGRGFYLPFNWRGFLDFGTGSLGDMACHILGAAHMALRLTAPTSVEVLEAEGRNSVSFPKSCKIRYEFPARPGMPPVKVYWYDARKDPPIWPEGLPKDELLVGPGVEKLLEECGVGTMLKPERVSRPWVPEKPPSQANGALFIGTKGILVTDTYANTVRLLPASRMEGYKLPPRLLTRSPGHYRDWIRACKGGEPACSNFSVAGPFTEWVVLGAVAMRFEGKLEWDAQRMRVTNIKEANQYVRPKFRKGWGL